MRESNLNELVSRRIRERSKEIGVTQAEIARATGAAKSSVNAWFNGATIPRGENLNSLGKILKCTQDWIFEGRGLPSALDADQFYAALTATWEVIPGEQPHSSLVKIPALLDDGEKDHNNVKVFPTDAVSMMPSINSVAWHRSQSDSAGPLVRFDDVVLVDSSIRSITRSGALYVISAARVMNICRVFVEFDGSLTIEDSERGSKLSVSPELNTSVSIIGQVIYRCGKI